MINCKLCENVNILREKRIDKDTIYRYRCEKYNVDLITMKSSDDTVYTCIKPCDKCKEGDFCVDDVKLFNFRTEIFHLNSMYGATAKLTMIEEDELQENRIYYLKREGDYVDHNGLYVYGEYFNCKCLYNAEIQVYYTLPLKHSDIKIYTVEVN